MSRFTRRAFNALTVLTAIVLSPQIAAACGCYPFKTVLKVFEEADIVVITRLLSVNKATDGETRFGSDISGATMVVEKVYKGDVKVGDKLTFSQGDEVVGCSWSFDRRPESERSLLYLYAREKSSDPWYISTCNRSRPLENAKEDLLYLDNIEKRRGRTRISGVVDSSADFNLEGRKIRITGNGRTYSATIDKDGVYEIYDVPPGRYILEPELPFGWRVDQMLPTTPNPTRADFLRHGSKRVSFTLRPKKHFGVYIDLVLSNHVSGTVTDSISKPLKSVCVSLLPANDESFEGCNALTDDRGRFRINSIEAGNYVLLIKRENRVTTALRFPRLYYPGVTDREKATVFPIKHGESVSRLKIIVN